jgi:hypothetical protein
MSNTELCGVSTSNWTLTFENDNIYKLNKLKEENINFSMCPQGLHCKIDLLSATFQTGLLDDYKLGIPLKSLTSEKEFRDMTGCSEFYSMVDGKFSIKNILITGSVDDVDVYNIYISGIIE